MTFQVPNGHISAVAGAIFLAQRNVFDFASNFSALH